ncbi:MAG TPA: hypothetical protein PKE29_13705 [Phycisphaerales bacterium]|nr:hypothetical protein [Phycisphaerales bacterium]
MSKGGRSTSKSLADRVRASGGWIRNPYAAELSGKRWRLTLDPDLVELLSAEGSPADRLFGLAALRAKSKRERVVVSIPLTDSQFRELRPLIDRLGAEVRYVPPHPSTKRAASGSRAARKAG